jgi:hypothetical protein
MFDIEHLSTQGSWERLLLPRRRNQFSEIIPPSTLSPPKKERELLGLSKNNS